MILGNRGTYVSARLFNAVNRMTKLFSIAIFCIAGASVLAAEYKVKPLTAEQTAEYKLDRSFYKKGLLVNDILIATSANVSDIAIREAAYQFDQIMGDVAKPVAKRIREKKVLCLLIAHNEFTSDLPQFKSEKTGKELDFYNWRNRGFLTHKLGRPTVVFAEEDVLEYEGGMQLESILIHEFGHVIHGAGFNDEQQKRLTECFERARAKGIWMDGRAAQRFRRVKSAKPVSLLKALEKSFPDQSPTLLKKCLNGGDILVNGKRSHERVLVTKADKVLIVFGGEKECYAHKNRAEYWAEGVQCWFNTNRTNDHDHNHIHTREQLKAYDVHLAKLCEEVLGDHEWRFVSPRLRAGKGHLKDFDPAKSPKVVDPEHIENAALDYYDKYWKNYWIRLQEKHALSQHLKQESIVTLAKEAREKGNAIRGAVLFPKQSLQCVNCHNVGGEDLLGPDLSQLDKKATDEYLVESLLDPSKTIKRGFESTRLITSEGKIFTGRIVAKSPSQITLRENAEPRRLLKFNTEDIDEIKTDSKSLMPDDLVDQLANRQGFLDLVRYLMSLAEAEGAQPLAAEESKKRTLSEELRGELLLSKLNCVACHEDADSLLPPKQAPKLAWSVGKINPAWMQRFIANPQEVKPGATMPHMLAGKDAETRDEIATAITNYLVAGQSKFEPEETNADKANHGYELFHTVGCVACHSPRKTTGEEIGLADSVPLGVLHAKYNMSGLRDFLKKPHDARPSGRMPDMQLSHFEAQDIAYFLLQRSSQVEPASFVADERLIAKGKELFETIGCNECHSAINKPKPRDFAKITGVANSGCLSRKPGEWPQFQLSDDARAAIVSALKGKAAYSEQDQVDATLAANNCVACHDRNGLGGVADNRSEFFQTTNLNLGQQGRIPPTLSGVGAKLNAKWLRDVLVNGKSIRPYMKTRMPQFGAANVEHLVSLLESQDTLPKAEYATFTDEKLMRNTGRELAGSSGLNCVACHNYQQKPAGTMPAVDLTEMHARLQKDWFYHYMQSPQRFSKNTVMPTFFPGGKAMRKDMLEGDAKLQIEALWQYLKDGRQAGAPRGVIRQPMELLATDEAVMLRRSYPGIGKRGIGVGYPNRVNLAYDAQQMRLAAIWKGKFADPGGVWRSQGHGQVRPLGTDVVTFEVGPEFESKDSPWKPEDGRPAKHQFKGYILDDLRRPRFQYRFDGVEVEDYFTDPDSLAEDLAALTRRLTFRSEKDRNDTQFRLATGKSIVEKGKGVFVIDDKLRMTVDDPQNASIEKSGDKKVLVLKVHLVENKTRTFVVKYQW